MSCNRGCGLSSRTKGAIGEPVQNNQRRMGASRPDERKFNMARRAFVGGLYHKVQAPKAIGSMTGHAEGSKAFARYRKVELELKKSLTDMLD